MQLIAEVGDELLDVLFLYELEPLNLQVQGPDGGPPVPLNDTDRYKFSAKNSCYLMHRQELVLFVGVQLESFVKTFYPLDSVQSGLLVSTGDVVQHLENVLHLSEVGSAEHEGFSVLTSNKPERRDEKL